MSLTELRQRYSPERSLDERLKLLEVAATHLPAPEFLWYPVAIEALASHELAERRAAMRLLAFAPQSWDQVLVVALTNADVELQRAALAALATQARAWPELVEAFGTLGSLPGWQPESLDVWRQAMAMLAPTTEPDGDAGALEAVRRRLENALTERERLQAQLDALTHQADAAAAERDELQAALSAERRGAKDIGDRMERLIAMQDADAEQWRKDQAELDSLYKRHRLAVIGSAVTMGLLLLVSGSLGWTLTNQKASSAMAASPAAPAAMEEALKAAEEAGYRRAIAGLADHAGGLIRQGRLASAADAWQAYAQLAPTPTEAQLGTKNADALRSRLKGGQAAGVVLAAEPKRTLAATPTRVHAVAPVRHAPVVRQTAVIRHHAPIAPAPAVAAPAAAAPATSAPAIPDQVRAKF